MTSPRWSLRLARSATIQIWALGAGLRPRICGDTEIHAVDLGHPKATAWVSRTTGLRTRPTLEWRCHPLHLDGNPAEHVPAVRQLRLDVAFVTGTRDWPECETEYLWSEGVFVVLPEMRGLCARDNASWHELVHEAFIVSEAAPGQEIHDFLVQRLASLGHPPDIRQQEVGRDNVLQWSRSDEA